MSNIKKQKGRISFSQGVTLSTLAFCIFLCLHGSAKAEDDIQFNTDVLDVKDKANIDLGQFSKRGYIMPGVYTFKIKVNQNEIHEQDIPVYPAENDPKNSMACFNDDLVKAFGFKDKYQQQLKTWHQGQCIDVTAIEGVTVDADLGRSVINITVPQAYLEYVSDDWVPPSMWDEGIPGLLADYNINTDITKHEGSDSDSSASGNGTVGANLGAWRLRADWQANYDDPYNLSGGESGSSQQKTWEWSRYYLYRALPKLGAKLTMGEDYSTSDIFDSFRFAGLSVVSDNNMLPPNLRGYAPEVTGVARTNAKVTISQQGRVIYETQVAAGPFSIQDLSSATVGTLDVHVQEQDGSSQDYKVNTASIPYLARPGSFRYKFFAGKPSDEEHHTEGGTFGSGEFSWGISNGWSLYGGLIANADYRALAVGIGRDLLALGAIALDITRSDTKLDDQRYQGQSYRVSYSKRFDDLGSQITFAGYRFSDKDFMSFNDFLNHVASDDLYQQSKEMYTVTFNQQFDAIGLSAYVNYSHQTYWNSPAEDRYSLSLANYFDVGRVKNISLSLTAYRNKFNGEKDDGVYVSLSLPWGDNGTLGYDATQDDAGLKQRLSYSHRLERGDNYQVAAGTSSDDMSFSGYYDHLGDSAEISSNVDYEQNSYSSAGLTLRGGVTATTKGAALHRVNAMGGTRMLVDTEGAADIPIQGYGANTETNMLGNAVITDVGDYSKNSIKIDLDAMPENADSSNSVIQSTLTEGAIGYNKFDVISGLKMMVIIRLADGSFPPFGAVVHNKDNQELGIVNDDGQTYLTGVQPGASMQVLWDGVAQCSVQIPEKIDKANQESSLLLPCHR